MIQEYSSYEISALQQLAGFRYIFYADVQKPDAKNKRDKEGDFILHQSIDSFIEIFCQNNFADTDYSVIQNRPLEFESADRWIDQINIDTVLKCLTYIIWNNKIDEGYFLKKIHDGLIEKHLSRLENILNENNMPLNLANNTMFIVSVSR
ncbi:MAG: DUF6508 domain-containing protein [Panacibacter sp.]